MERDIKAQKKYPQRKLYDQFSIPSYFYPINAGIYIEDNID